MGRVPTNVQETVLNLCRKEQIRCIVYLCNGVQLRGVITGFDNFTILLEDEHKQQIVYKHAVTTVQPMKRLDLRQAGVEDVSPLIEAVEAPEAPPEAEDEAADR